MTRRPARLPRRAALLLLLLLLGWAALAAASGAPGRLLAQPRAATPPRSHRLPPALPSHPVQRPAERQAAVAAGSDAEAWQYWRAVGIARGGAAAEHVQEWRPRSGLLAGAVVTLLAVLSWVAAALVRWREAGGLLVGPPHYAACTVSAESSVRFIDLGQALQLWRSGQCTVLDVRSDMEMAFTTGPPSGRAGVVQVPLLQCMLLRDEAGELSATQHPNLHFVETVQRLVPDAGGPLVVVCADGRQRAPQAATMLCQAGYSQVLLLRGRYADFAAGAGYPEDDDDDDDEEEAVAEAETEGDAGKREAGKGAVAGKGTSPIHALMRDLQWQGWKRPAMAEHRLRDAMARRPPDAAAPSPPPRRAPGERPPGPPRSPPAGPQPPPQPTQPPSQPRPAAAPAPAPAPGPVRRDPWVGDGGDSGGAASWSARQEADALRWMGGEAARNWEFASAHPSIFEMQEFVDWFLSQPYLDVYALPPGLEEQVCEQLHRLARKFGVHSRCFGTGPGRYLAVSKTGTFHTGEGDLDSPLQAARLEDCPREVREPVTLFLQQRRPVCSAMPRRRLWALLSQLCRQHRICLRFLRELDCVVLLEPSAVSQQSGANLLASKPFVTEALTMSPQLFQYLKRAADEAWFRHEASPHLSAAGTSTGGYRPAVPEDTRHYLTDYQKRAHYDQFRLQLPIYKSRIPILDAIHGSRVVILDGPTGAGKSTQVPQYIIDASGLLPDDSPVVIVTQPRRLAAINVATRVAQERGQDVGDEVGYQVRFATCMGPNTRLVFMTSGVLLRRLHDDPSLAGVGCVIVDEVHERSLDIDFILLLMKQSLLRRATRARLVVMSATLQAQVFVDYFQEVLAMDRPPVGPPTPYPPVPHHVHFEGRQFPVQDFYLEDALAWTGLEVDPQTNELVQGNTDVSCWQAIKGHLGVAAMGEVSEATPPPRVVPPLQRQSPVQRRSPVVDGDDFEDSYEEDLLSRPAAEAITNGLRPRPNPTAALDWTRVHPLLVVQLIVELHHTGYPGGVLVFLPGLQEIRDVRALLLRQADARAMNVISLHSMLPLAQQRALFEPSPAGQRKVVLSTNIAESSVTVEDVVFVIDSGLLKTRQYHAARDLSSLDNLPVSRANAIQRRGRAGRVQPGVCIHLFPRSRWASMPDALETELRRTPLEEVVLQLKALDVGDVHRFLGQAIDPPPPQTVDNAVRSLQALGVLTGDTAGALTHVGRALARLPLHPRLGRMLLVAALLGVLKPVVAIVAIFANRSPILQTLSPEAAREQRDIRMSFVDRAADDSDPLLMLRLLEQWEKSGQSAAFCQQAGLSGAIMREIRNTHQQYVDLLQADLPLYPNTFCHRNVHDSRLVAAAVTLCLYPQVAGLRRRRWWSPDPPCPVDLGPNALLRVNRISLLDVMEDGGIYIAYVGRTAVTTRDAAGAEDAHIVVDGCGLLGQLSLALACHAIQPVPVYCGVDPQGAPLLLCDDWLAIRFESVELLQTVTKAHFLLREALETFAHAPHQPLAPHFLSFVDALAQCLSPDLPSQWTEQRKARRVAMEAPAFTRRLRSMQRIAMEEDPELVPQYRGRPVLGRPLPPPLLGKGKGKGKGKGHYLRRS